MENKFPFRTANSMGKRVDLTRLDDGLREVEEIDSDTDSGSEEEESDDEVVEVIPVREDEEIVVKMEDDENKSTHISVNATPPESATPPG